MLVPIEEHIRNVVLCELHKNFKTSVAAKSIQRAHGVDALSERTCRDPLSF